MYKKINLQFLIPYFGLLPYFIIIIDKFFLHQFEIDILKSFSFFYSIIIFVFIGSINWNLKESISIKLVIYGFSPSFFAVFLILMYLHEYKVVFLLIFFFLLQLFLDYFLVYRDPIDKKPYYLVRLPLTFAIVLSLFIIQ